MCSCTRSEESIPKLYARFKSITFLCNIVLINNLCKDSPSSPLTDHGRHQRSNALWFALLILSKVSRNVTTKHIISGNVTLQRSVGKCLNPLSSVEPPGTLISGCLLISDIIENNSGTWRTSCHDFPAETIDSEISLINRGHARSSFMLSSFPFFLSWKKDSNLFHSFLTCYSIKVEKNVEQDAQHLTSCTLIVLTHSSSHRTRA